MGGAVVERELDAEGPAWWTVDLFVEPGGAIAAITLDRYEP